FFSSNTEGAFAGSASIGLRLGKVFPEVPYSKYAFTFSLGKILTAIPLADGRPRIKLIVGTALAIDTRPNASAKIPATAPAKTERLESSIFIPRRYFETMPYLWLFRVKVV
ncbi:MAG: hypothetical protein ACKN92_09640, partial [Candidatus Nanopelagicaceae bacterium]